MQGSLSEFTLAELLQLFALAERTGTVEVHSPNRASRILLESGRIVGIGQNDFDVHRELTACELLPARSGAALEAVVPTPGTPGLSFIVSNLVDPDRWTLFATRCVEQQVYPLLNASRGSFEIEIERVPFCPLALSVSVQQLVLDGSRWEAEMAEYRLDGFGLSTAWQRTEQAPKECAMSLPDWLVWAALETPGTISRTAARVCIPDLDATAAIRRLADAGFLCQVS